MGPNGIHPRVPRELVEAFTKPLPVVCQQCWLTRQVPVDWTLAHMMPVYKKGGSSDLQPISLTSVPGKGMEKIISSTIT